jgi:hypothetical protein
MVELLSGIRKLLSDVDVSSPIGVAKWDAHLERSKYEKLAYASGMQAKDRWEDYPHVIIS